MTHYTASDVEMIDRHIAGAEQHIATQERMLTALQIKGHSTNAAAAFLVLLQDMLAEHRKHRDAVIAALDHARRIGGRPVPTPGSPRRS